RTRNGSPWVSSLDQRDLRDDRLAGLRPAEFLERFHPHAPGASHTPRVARPDRPASVPSARTRPLVAVVEAAHVLDHGCVPIRTQLGLTGLPSANVQSQIRRSRYARWLATSSGTPRRCNRRSTSAIAARSAMLLSITLQP